MNENRSTTREYAIFAGGCFWGVEYYLQKLEGVFTVVSGYIGGSQENPTYEQVKAHLTGHAEAVRVEYDPKVINYESIAKMFFEIHDPTQLNGQGYDLGEQYRSEVFYLNDEQRDITHRLIETLKSNGYDVVTKLTAATQFYPAEDYHQDYYEIKHGEPDCHFYTQRF